MMYFSSRENLRRRADIGLIVAFFVLIWLPTADKLLNLDRAQSMNENRPYAKFPKYQATLDGTRKFLSGLEAYFNDSFGFRRQLVRWERQLRWDLFHDTRGATVLKGKGDWLFFSDGRTVDDISGALPFSAVDLENWRTLLSGRRDWLKARGIAYLLVVPPDKQSVYPEELPSWLLARAGPARRLDQFFAYMRDHSDVPVLDLRPALAEAKTHGEIYLHTDTHWNDRGAFAAYRRIMEELGALGLPAKALGAESFDETLSNQPGGDLVRLLGREGLVIEKDAPILSPKPPMPEIAQRPYLGMPGKKWLPITEPVFSENPDAKMKALVFRDSFSGYLIKFFGYHFSRIVYLWQQNWDKPLIEREKPDVVMDVILERFLIYRNPETLLLNDEHPEAQSTTDR
jgi:hypothetical protein